MNNNDEFFDNKMKEEFKRETEIIPKDINDAFDNILEIERNKEKCKMGKLKRFGITAASLVCVSTLVMQTAFAQDIVNKIAKSLSIKGLTVYENNTQEDMWARDVPEAAKGKVFDNDGNIVDYINSYNLNDLYNSEGEHVWVDHEGTLLTDEEMDEKIRKNEEENADDTLVITDLNELEKHINFKVRYPEYVPEGFEFMRAECDNHEKNGLDNSVWYDLEYENKQSDKKIYIQVTEIIDGEHGETFFDNIEEGKVNGNDAIISDDSISWSCSDVKYTLFMYDLGKEEGMKIAESIK